MSEIDGAMFTVQLPKLEAIISKRRSLGRSLTGQISQIPGIIPQKQPDQVNESYFFYLFRIDPQRLKMTREAFVTQLRAEGIPASGAYVPVPMYQAPYFRNKSFFPDGVWPAEIVSGRTYDYNKINLPGVQLAVATGVSLPLHEGFSELDISDYVNAISKVAGVKQ